ncbi:MAG: right-handed parallel beta-helix repeat-containing protein, partial [Pseudomonadota bacterium]
MTEKAKQPTTFHYILFSIIICISLIFSTDLFAETSISGIIAQDTTWTVDGSPYIVTGSVTVQGTDGTDGITSLTIEPGVEVRFNRYMMMTIGGTSGAPGALSAQGSTDNKIYFTSNQASPAPGDWYYIKFNTTTDDATTILDNCVVEYAGVSQGAINIYSASPTIQNSLIKNNKNAGVYIAYGSAILTNNTISDNTTYGVNMTGSSSEISNTSFNNNGNYDIYSGGVFTGKVNNNEIRNGLYTGSGAFPDLSGNTIQYNNAYPLRMGADSVGALMADNTITGTDAQSFMEVTTDTIEKDATWTSILKYHILGNLIVQGTDGTDGITTLTIEPDVEVRFNRYIMMTIGGTSGAPGALSAQGSTDNKIYFTSNQAS